jgi:hypothetical protein
MVEAGSPTEAGRRAPLEGIWDQLKLQGNASFEGLHLVCTGLRPLAPAGIAVVSQPPGSAP